MASIVDPGMSRGGAWTATRGLVRLFGIAWPGAIVDCIAPPSYSRFRHRVRQARCMLQSAAGTGQGAKVDFARSRKILGAVSSSMRAHPPDVLLLNGTDMLWLLPFLPAERPVFLIAHNIEHELYADQIDLVTSRWPLLSGTLTRDLGKLRNAEMSAFRNVDGAIFLSEDDETAMKAELQGLASIALPPVFDYMPRARTARTGDILRIGLFADFTWWPNREGLRWFLSDVWPGVAQHVELHLFGHGSEPHAAAGPRVRAHGFVDDPRDPFTQCDIMIAPVQRGGGVKVKVAEALYNRAPVVASPLALRGLPAQTLPAVHACRTAEEWAGFLNSREAVEFAGRTGSEEAAQHFSPEHSAPRLRDFFSPVSVAASSA